MTALRALVEQGLARIGYTPAQTLGVMDEIGPALDAAETEVAAWRDRSNRLARELADLHDQRDMTREEGALAALDALQTRAAVAGPSPATDAIHDACGALWRDISEGDWRAADAVTDNAVADALQNGDRP